MDRLKWTILIVEMVMIRGNFSDGESKAFSSGSRLHHSMRQLLNSEHCELESTEYLRVVLCYSHYASDRYHLHCWCLCAGDHFGIGVSGYPEAHPDAIVEDKEQMEKNYWSDIHYLKEKLDAGADFVVTQLFYDVDRFIAWVKDCRSIGITAPIIPGIMPIMAYGGFNRMTSFCKTIVPQEIRDRVEALKDDDAGLKAYGVQLGCQMCKKILDAKVSPGGENASCTDTLVQGVGVIFSGL